MNFVQINKMICTLRVISEIFYFYVAKEAGASARTTNALLHFIVIPVFKKKIAFQSHSSGIKK